MSCPLSFHDSFALITYPDDQTSTARTARDIFENLGVPTVAGRFFVVAAGASTTIVSGPARHMVCEGYATVRGQISSGAALARHLLDDGPTRGGQQSYSYLSCDEKRISAGTDWLGLRQVYYSRHEGNTTLISNDLSWHSRVMQLLGYPPHPDLDALLLLSASGSPLSENASIAGVKLLAGRDACHVDRHGRFDIRGTSRVSNEMRRLSSVELRALACEEMQSNLRGALAAYPERTHILELSGGIDSRLVLATAMSLGLQDRVRCNTRGGSPQDTAVAAEIRASLGLTAVNAPTSFEDVSFPQFLEASRMCGGQNTMGDIVQFGHSRAVDRVVYTGGHGETFRNPYAEGLMVLGTPPETIDRPSSPSADLRAFRRRFLKRFILWKHREQAILERAREIVRGLDGDDMGQKLQFLYSDYRNRFHFGLLAAIRCTRLGCFQILHSEAAIALSLKIPSTHRAWGLTSFELIEHMFPPLMLYPFAKRRVADEYLRTKPWQGLVRSREESLASAPPAAVPPPRVRIETPPSIKPPRVRQAYLDTAVRLCELISSEVQERLGLEAIKQNICTLPSGPSLALARNFIGPLGWIYWLEEVRRAPADVLRASFAHARPFDALQHTCRPRLRGGPDHPRTEGCRDAPADAAASG